MYFSLGTTIVFNRGGKEYAGEIIDDYFNEYGYLCYMVHTETGIYSVTIDNILGVIA